LLLPAPVSARGPSGLVGGESVRGREAAGGRDIVAGGEAGAGGEAVVRESVTGEGVPGPVPARREGAARAAAAGEVGVVRGSTGLVRRVEVRRAPCVGLGVGLGGQIRRRAHRGRAVGQVTQGVRATVVGAVGVRHSGGAARGGAAGGGASVASHVLAFLVLAVASSFATSPKLDDHKTHTNE